MKKSTTAPSDYVPFLADNKLLCCSQNVRGFGGPVSMEADIKLSVRRFPKLRRRCRLDAIRCIALAQSQKIGGVLEETSAALMKRPLVQKEESEAADALESWIQQFSVRT